IAGDFGNGRGAYPIAQPGEGHLPGGVRQAHADGQAAVAHRQGDAVSLDRIDVQVDAYLARHGSGCRPPAQYVLVRRAALRTAICLLHLDGLYAVSGRVDAFYGAAVVELHARFAGKLRQALRELERVARFVITGVDASLQFAAYRLQG